MDILSTVKKLRALDNEVKLEILSYLVNQGSKSITDISKELKLNFSTAHKYLEELEAAGLVKSKQEVKSRLKRIFYINDFEINISPRALSRFQDQTVRVDKPEHDFNVITLTGRLEKFDRTRFIKDYLELGLPQNIIDLILDALLPNVYNNITTLELRKRFLQELEGRNDILWTAINKLKEVKLGQTNYLNFLTSVHPEAIEQHVNGEIFIENLGRPKLLNFVHDLRGISVHGVDGKTPVNLSDFLNQILKAVNSVLNFSKPIHSFDSLNYFIAPYTSKLSDYEIEQELREFFKKLNAINLRTFINIEVGEPAFAKELPTEYFARGETNVYSEYSKEAKRLIKIICGAAKTLENLYINLKLWAITDDLNELIKPGVFISNMNCEWQQKNSNYIYDSRFDSKWKGWFRSVRTGTVQNISINIPLIAKQAGNKLEFTSKLEEVIAKATDYIAHTSILFLNTSLSGTSISFKSKVRTRWSYIPFEDAVYCISLVGINETARMLNQKLQTFRNQVISTCNKILNKNVNAQAIRLVLKEEHNPLILERFREINKLNNILYLVGQDYTTEELIESANHEKLRGGHLLSIKLKDLDLKKLLTSKLGLVRVVE